MMLRGSRRERRRFRRASLNTELLYKVVRTHEGGAPAQEAERTTSLTNISSGGVAFLSDVDVPVRTGLEVKFRFDLKGHGELTIAAAGDVRYCIQRGDYRSYQVGIEFTRIAEADARFIADYVRAPFRKRI
jgi:c-di-GMP-binding flagellar brake protein YcgR